MLGHEQWALLVLYIYNIAYNTAALLISFFSFLTQAWLYELCIVVLGSPTRERILIQVIWLVDMTFYPLK